MTVHVPPPASVDLDQARRFLAKAVPWPVNGDGYINIIWSEKKPGTEQPIWSGRACRTLDEAVGALTWITKKQGKREIYVCMSSQRTAQEKSQPQRSQVPSADPQPAKRASRSSLSTSTSISRVASTATTRPDDAINAIAGFLKASGLPKPSMIVKSGGGLHIYFTLPRPLSREEWQPLAHALAEAGKRHGLKADWQVTTDSARILRIPGTTNNKQDVPRPVTLAAIPGDGSRSGHPRGSAQAVHAARERPRLSRSSSTRCYFLRGRRYPQDYMTSWAPASESPNMIRSTSTTLRKNVRSSATRSPPAARATPTRCGTSPRW